MTNAIGWAIVHSTWQVGLIAALIATLLFLTRRSSANVRYTICVAGLVLSIALPVGTVLQSRGGSAAAPPFSSFSATTPQTPASTADARTDIPAAGATRVEVSGAATFPQPSVRGTLEAALPWIVVLWLIGVVLFSFRTIGGLLWARSLVRKGTKPVSDAIRGASARLADALGVRVAVRVLQSTRVSVPMLVGWLRPVILLPVSVLTGLTPLQIEAILAHELAHVRRHDYLVNLLQTVVETLFFFHPAVWWLSGRIREERENACDELAVRLLGGDRVFYSRTLLSLEESRPAIPELAVAATGGSLKRRVQRLLGAEQAHLDIGPRWYAGVFTVVMAVTAAGGVAEERLPQPGSPPGIAQDTVNPRPSDVLRYTGDANLESRWRWVQSQARQRNWDRYWIGYLIDGDPSHDTWVHYDRYTPVHLGNGGVISGGIRMVGDFGSVRVPGVSLHEVVGENEPSSIAVFVAYDNGRLARVRLGSFIFPMSFGNAPVVWLGHASDAESITRLAALDAGTTDLRLREDLTSMIAAHNDAGAVVPVLERWALDASRNRSVREEAVQGLQNFSSPRALAVLSRIARSDTDERVRTEAVDALSHLQESSVVDTLRSFALTLTTERLRREAVDALAGSEDRRGIAVLRDIVNDRTADRRLQSEAVEALADAKADESERVRVLLEIVNNHPDEYIQGRAAEALGDVKADAAVPALAQIARTHRSYAVRHRAIEALSNFESDDRAARVLLDIANSDADLAMRRRAIESLGDFHQLPVFDELSRLARNAESMEVRRAAIEAYLDNADPDRATTFARTLIASNAPIEVKREVMDGLASMDDGNGIPLLIEIARTTNDQELRRRALETLIESDDPRAVAALSRIP
jgi:beta-lactamase regulating signal transducer with metallopeptidase domain/HEAT repeat protein